MCEARRERLASAQAEQTADEVLPSRPRDIPSRLMGALSRATFNQLSVLVHRECGIRMPYSKHPMLQARLQKRLRALSLTSFSDYYDYVSAEHGAAELVEMVDVVTTNKTDFYREPTHFDFLRQNVLPALHEERGDEPPVQVWSAACATGEEPYTLAMELAEFQRDNPSFQFSVLATDVSTRVLEHARMAIYASAKADAIPAEIRRRYVMRSKDRAAAKVRIVPELRRHVHVRQLNFIATDWSDPPLMDVVFCRNVMIYFDRPQQQRILARICGRIRPGGYLFLGHSETANWLDLPLRQLAPSVHQVTR